MADAAHPQPDVDERAKRLHASNGPRGEDHEQAWAEAPEQTRETYRNMVREPEPAPDEAAAKNPFPPSMTVPHIDGGFITIELAVVDGVVYAPRLDEAPINVGVRQYVLQYCAAWSSSVLVGGKLEQSWPAPPRRAQIIVPESQLHAMLGLAADERLLRVAYDDVSGGVRFVVESPRLPRQPYWDGGPPVISLPVAAAYEQTAP